jgi:hypothetical protein
MVTTTGARSRARAATPPRWVELFPTVVLVVAVIVKVVVSPNAARDVFSSPRALAVTLGVTAGWLLLWLVVLPRFVRNGWIRVGILFVVAVGLSVALVLPSVRDTKVVESFPAPARATATSGPAGSAPPSTAAAPIRVAAGALAGIDHDATGEAVLYEQADGTHVVGLEGIDVEPGPDYLVYLVPGVDRAEPGGEAVELDRLRGNQGTQYYPVPAGTNVEAGNVTILIWCRAFAVPIANATPV